MSANLGYAMRPNAMTPMWQELKTNFREVDVWGDHRREDIGADFFLAYTGIMISFQSSEGKEEDKALLPSARLPFCNVLTHSLNYALVVLDEDGAVAFDPAF